MMSSTLPNRQIASDQPKKALKTQTVLIVGKKARWYHGAYSFLAHLQIIFGLLPRRLPILSGLTDDLGLYSSVEDQIEPANRRPPPAERSNP